MPQIDLHNYEAFLLDYYEGNLDPETAARLKAFILAHPELDIDLGDTPLPYLLKETETADFKLSLKKTELPLQDETLLNYLEDTLTAEQRRAFEARLAIDQELAKSLEYYKKTILPVNPIRFEYKAELYRSEDELALNNSLIAYLEGGLSPAEKLQTERELSENKDLQREWQALSKTVLVADASIIYPDKAALKKGSRIIPLFSLRNIGSVAAAVLLLLGFAGVYNYYTRTPETTKSGLAKHTPPVSSSKPSPNRDTPQSSVQQKTTYTATIQPAVPAPSNNIGTQVEQNLAAPQEKNNPAREIHPEKEPVPQLAEQKNKGSESKTEPAQDPSRPLEPAPDLASAAAHLEDSITNRQNYLLLAEDNDEDFTGVKDTGKGFWKRAVSLAKHANKLGVKSVDGEENTESKYRLSFNSFSVGKK